MFLTCTSLKLPSNPLETPIPANPIKGRSSSSLLIETKIFVLSSLMHVSSGLVKTEQSFTVFLPFQLVSAGS